MSQQYLPGRFVASNGGGLAREDILEQPCEPTANDGSNQYQRFQQPSIYSLIAHCNPPMMQQHVPERPRAVTHGQLSSGVARGGSREVAAVMNQNMPHSILNTSSDNSQNASRQWDVPNSDSLPEPPGLVLRAPIPPRVDIAASSMLPTMSHQFDATSVFWLELGDILPHTYRATSLIHVDLRLLEWPSFSGPEIGYEKLVTRYKSIQFPVSSRSNEKESTEMCPEVLTLHAEVSGVSTGQMLIPCQRCMIRERNHHLGTPKKQRGWKFETCVDGVDLAAYSSPITFSKRSRLELSSGRAKLGFNITCYCSHRGEKIGFRVRFFLKDQMNRTIGSAETGPIMIKDDHNDPDKRAERKRQRSERGVAKSVEKQKDIRKSGDSNHEEVALLDAASEMQVPAEVNGEDTFGWRSPMPSSASVEKETLDTEYGGPLNNTFHFTLPDGATFSQYSSRNGPTNSATNHGSSLTDAYPTFNMSQIHSIDVQGRGSYDPNNAVPMGYHGWPYNPPMASYPGVPSNGSYTGGMSGMNAPAVIPSGVAEKKERPTPQRFVRRR